MSNAKNSPDPIDIHRVQSTLLSFGGSFFGAQQLLAGQIVTNPADRKALAAMILGLLRHSSGKHHARGPSAGLPASTGQKNPGMGYYNVDGHGGKAGGGGDHK